MKAFIKDNYRFLLCAACGILSGFALGFALHPKLTTHKDDDTLTVDHIGLINILPSTAIHCTYRFSGCDHTIERTIDPLKYVGQTQDEFIKEYRDCEINHFSSETVQMHCLRIGPCPKHIMLRADESGQIGIYQTDTDSLEVVNIQKLPLYAGSFPSEIAEELYEGIVFQTIDEINEYLENMES